MRARTFIIISALSLGGFVWSNLAAWRLESPLSQGALTGKKVWQKHNCISCHTLFGNGGYVGDDLTRITMRRTPEEIIQYMVNPGVMRPNKKRTHPALEPDDAKQLVEYLDFVSRINTLGWPPEPMTRRNNEY